MARGWELERARLLVTKLARKLGHWREIATENKWAFAKEHMKEVGWVPQLEPGLVEWKDDMKEEWWENDWGHWWDKVKVQCWVNLMVVGKE